MSPLLRLVILLLPLSAAASAASLRRPHTGFLGMRGKRSVPQMPPQLPPQLLQLPAVLLPQSDSQLPGQLPSPQQLLQLFRAGGRANDHLGAAVAVQGGLVVLGSPHDHYNFFGEFAGRAQIHLMDYRELAPDRPFDKIASVGMFEHVGRARLPTYFEQVHRLLVPGGLLLNHGITAGGTRNAQLGAGIGEFIGRYIFPGGELVHLTRMERRLCGAGVELVDGENLRPHYARTLWAWSDALEQNLAQARSLTSEATVRAYRLYLAGCAMCFEQGWLSIYQLLASRPDGLIASGSMRGAQSVYPFNREHMVNSTHLPSLTRC